MSWRKKRQLLIAFFVLAPVALVLVLWFFFSRPAPTCFDGFMNQDEIGIDCGGSCTAICQDQVPSPVLIWSRAFQITDTEYSLIALIQNGVDDFGARNVPYAFRFLDEKGDIVKEVVGSSDIPPVDSFVVYVPRTDFEDITPGRVTFDFTEQPDWQREEGDDTFFSFRDTRYSKHTLGTRVEASAKLLSNTAVSNVTFVAVVFDSSGTAINASQTFRESFSPNEEVPLVFTWPSDLVDRISSVEIFLSSFDVSR